MEESKITFENKDGSKKATMTVTINEDKTMDVDIVFDPEIKTKGNKDTYAILASMFMKQLTSN